MPSPTSSPRPPASLTARSASLPDLAEILRGQHAAKLDAITQAGNLHADGGLLRVAGADHAPTIDGVTRTDAWPAPTEAADASIAHRRRRTRHRSSEGRAAHGPAARP